MCTTGIVKRRMVNRFHRYEDLYNCVCLLLWADGHWTGVSSKDAGYYVPLAGSHDDFSVKNGPRKLILQYVHSELLCSAGLPQHEKIYAARAHNRQTETQLYITLYKSAPGG